jgi:CubicO group peptidase (beta-lactamase class C family)
MELATLPGLGMAVVRPGVPLWQHYSGMANFNTKSSITADSLFPGCSLGKPMFACLVLRLALEGKLDLNRPLNAYLKDDALTGAWGDKVTPRHVLSHTTGLPNWRWQNDQKLTPTFEPGSRFGYSGEGFFHLQRVVEHVTGTGFEDLMQEHIFKPLEMHSSTFLWLPDANDRLVAGHRGTDPFYNRDLAIEVFGIIQSSGKPLSFWTYEEIASALMKKPGHTSAPQPNEFVPNVAFALLTTVSDYARFLAALVNPADTRLGLSPATRTAMQTPVSHINSALSWGLGIGVEKTETASYLWQWGDNGGWKNFILAHPSTQTAIAVFTNGSNGQHVNERVVRAATEIEHPAFLWI